LATASDLVFYGTLEGYLKIRDAKTGKELYRFKTPSGIVGNVNTWKYKGKQYIGVLSGIGGWAGMGVATEACKKDPKNGALGSCSAYVSLNKWTKAGGVFTVFALPEVVSKLD
jgi:glucose dehydrogenase